MALAPKMGNPENSADRLQLAHSLHDAFVSGNFVALAQLLGPSPRWFDEPVRSEFLLCDIPLELAIQ